MITMEFFCVSLFCVVTFQTVFAFPDSPSADDMASSPLIQQLLDRVDMLEQQGAKQSDEIQLLKEEMSHQRGYFKTLRSKLYTKDKLIQNLLRRGVEQAKEIQCMKTQISQQKVYMKKLRSKIRAKDEMIKTFLDKINKRALVATLSGYSSGKRADSKITQVTEAKSNREENIQSHMKRILPVDNKPVAFYAIQTTNGYYDHSHHDTNYAFTNVGNAYNVSNGVFTAPVPGIYVFSASCGFKENVTDHASVFINGSRKDSIYTRNGMVSRTMIFELNQSDTVEIRILIDDAHPYSLKEHLWLSAFLLHQTYQGMESTPVIG